MPFEPHPAIYKTPLGACRIHKNLEDAEFASEEFLILDPVNPVAYVQVANVYVTKRKWESVSKVRKATKENNVVKTTRYGWITINNVIHEFRLGDRL
ncbi:hypothetical protein RD792_017264 [Penstemon davidsonii]|uniref:Uncharacterized protein n=1 Tax=Penstemon davidsonii TaxID=160366 RepID=A0ABR0CLR6_9LAMI|nr:hypothetical protein RD792_017264 [Penstemon davidsonii]